MTSGRRVQVGWVLATIAGCLPVADLSRAPAPMGQYDSARPPKPGKPVSPSEPTAPTAFYTSPPPLVPAAAAERRLPSSPVEEPPAPLKNSVRYAARLDPAEVKIVLRVRGSRTGELRNGDFLQSGDRLQLEVLSKTDSHLYLAYCNTEGDLAWFPPRGSIPAKADTLVTAPAERASIVMDDIPGLEPLYVLVSRQELSLADQELSQLLQSSSAGATTREPRGCTRRFIKRSPKGRNQNGRRAAGATSYDPPPTVELIRGGYIAWDDPQQVTARVDASGIAILRYAFTHVARRR